ncbi:hypothetical protein PVV74_17165 [Roseovarius sp. SK2]|uniref:hypothetical protein n=1 Tax=Roseovarius TaxID=74030 RepID=UPI00237BE174|nr:hypothetical protein [Roseovarius sp. SK2]MDD9727193.1 hypothetical protein [Roseovarius sp. SK2]
MTTEAPERIWAQDAEPSECDYTGGGWWDDECGSTQHSHTIEYVRADLATRQQAEAVGAAYEAAAGARGMWFGFNSEGEPDGSYCTVKAHDPGGMKLYVSHEAIRALTPSDATTALDRVKREVWDAAIEAAANAVSMSAWTHGGHDTFSQSMDNVARHQNEESYKAVLALKKGPTNAD